MFKVLTNILFPHYCLVCKKIGKSICYACYKKLEKTPLSCPYCLKKTKDGAFHDTCVRPGGIDGLISLFYYNRSLMKFLFGIKYRLAKGALQELFVRDDYIKQRVAVLKKHNIGAIVPIPLSRIRENKRGFNQSNIIAGLVSHQIKKPVWQVLIRKKNTQPLAKTKSKLERAEIIHNAFEVDERYMKDTVGKTLLLVDDVYTSGATTREAAKTLKACGVRRVFVFVVAQG
ncbi:ComF family protein [Candidatus Woesebacteria bacterium]|nr:ComF family protein [Candidatus Woesebacteria bacterium]